YETTTSSIYLLSLHDALPIWILDEIVKSEFDYVNSLSILRELFYIPLKYARRLGVDDCIDEKEIDQVFYGFQSIYALNSQLLHRSEEHTSELQSRENLVCRLL